LAALGKVLASGSPVALKRDLGDGYTIQVLLASPGGYEKQDSSLVQELLENIRAIAPLAFLSTPSPSQVLYHLKTRDSTAVWKVLGIIDSEVHMKSIKSYEILGTAIEDIFLQIMTENEAKDESSVDTVGLLAEKPVLLELPNGKPVSSFVHACTIFHKRLLIARRSWLGPFLMVIVAVAGSCIPLVFIAGKQQECDQRLHSPPATALYLPDSSILYDAGPSSQVVASPPNIISDLGPSVDLLNITNEPNNETFVNSISQNYRNLSLGGVSVSMETGASLVAWYARPPGTRGSSMLNLATNVLYNRALNSSGNARGTPVLIQANYATFPKVISHTFVYLKWLFFFGAAMVNTSF